MGTYLSKGMLKTLEYMAKPEIDGYDRKVMISQKGFIIKDTIVCRSFRRQLRMLHKQGLLTREERGAHYLYKITAKGKGLSDGLKITSSMLL